jgi:hypothetical protein
VSLPFSSLIVITRRTSCQLSAVKATGNQFRLVNAGTIIDGLGLID